MSKTSYKAIFFDLDGTLLPMDLDTFMGEYMALIGRYVVTKGMNIEAFQAGFKVGVRAMSENDSDRSNAEVFWDAFFNKVPDDRETWIPFFNDFYANDFGTLGEGVKANPYALRSVEILQEKGYPLVLATMPMFPQRAVDWRCTWAGINPKVFRRITNFENSTSVKPKLNYYAENLKAAGLQPHEVLMVGNNTKEDLACLDLGMDAFLITDYLLNPNNFDVSNVKHGSFETFISWITDLPVCVDPARAFITTKIDR